MPTSIKSKHKKKVSVSKPSPSASKPSPSVSKSSPSASKSSPSPSTPSPSTSTPSPSSDPFLPGELAKVTVMLQDNCLPPLRHVTCPPSDAPHSGPTVVLLSWPGERYAWLREGGRTAPGNVHLACSPSWISHSPDKRHLFLREGISFDALGQATHTVYPTPRKITYLANFFTPGATYNERDVSFAHKGLETPQSQSPSMERMLGDKFLTRVVLARARVAVPDTVALLYHYKRSCPSLEGLSITAMRISSAAQVKSSARIRKMIKGLLASLQERRGLKAKCVVKPSGPLWMGSAGVTFHEVSDVGGVFDAAEALVNKLHDGDAVLIEEFANTFAPQDILVARELPLAAVLNPFLVTETERVGDALLLLQKEARLALAARRKGTKKDVMVPVPSADDESGAATPGAPKHGTAGMHGNGGHGPLKVLFQFRLRALVQRSPSKDAPPIVAKMICGVGPVNEPLHGVNTTPQSLAVTLRQWGLTEERAKDVVDAVTSESRVAFDAITRFDKVYLPNAAARGGVRASVDAIGLDFILTSRGTGTIVPLCIEVNDHDSTYQAQLVEAVLPETSGDCVRPWVQCALRRSAEYLLVGKRVLLVGGGGFSKAATFKVALDAGIQVTLLDADGEHYAKDQVARLCHYPALDDHAHDAEHVEDIMNTFNFTPEDFDGVVTFWEDCVVLAGLLRERLGKRGDAASVAARCKSKIRTHAFLASKSDEVDWRPRASLYAVEPVPLDLEEPEEQLLSMMEERVCFPAVIKTEFGSSALGVKMVSSPSEALLVARDLVKSLTCEDDHPGSGLSFKAPSSALFLQTFVDGSEHDVDVVLWDGHILGTMVSDNAPTRLPYFAETACCAPSQLHDEWVKSLVAAARICLHELGCRNGVYNVELKMQSNGPKLIEVNCRAGGFYLSRFMHILYGWSNFHAAWSVAAGVKPFLPGRESDPRAPKYLVGAMLYASKHGEALRRNGLLERLNSGAVGEPVVWCQFEEGIPEVAEYEEPIGNIAVYAPSFPEARDKLMGILNVLGVDALHDELPLSWFLLNL